MYVANLVVSLANKTSCKFLVFFPVSLQHMYLSLTGRHTPAFFTSMYA